MPAVALTDHGSILGAVNFYKKAQQSEIKPIIGSELYLAAGSRFDKPNRREDELNYFHLLALVKNDQGYRNLCELITASFLEGFYRKPRIDKELLEKYKDGLLVMSACIQGEIPYHLLRGQRRQGRGGGALVPRDRSRTTSSSRSRTTACPSSSRCCRSWWTWPSELSIPLVASNDVHYLTREDADAREILICLQTTEVISNPDRAMKKETEQLYFKSSEEMAALFAAIAPRPGQHLRDRLALQFRVQAEEILPARIQDAGQDERRRLFRKDLPRGLRAHPAPVPGQGQAPEAQPRRNTRSGCSTRSRRSARWASPAISSSSGTSSASPRRAASRSARAAARWSAAWWPSSWASPTSTRWSTT